MSRQRLPIGSGCPIGNGRGRYRFFRLFSSDPLRDADAEWRSNRRLPSAECWRE